MLVFNILRRFVWSLQGTDGAGRALACLFPFSADAPLNGVPATPFGHEHALKRKILRQVALLRRVQPPGEKCGLVPASLLDRSNKPLKIEPFAKFGSALGQPWVSPWERGRPARILVKALPRRQSAGEPTNPVKPIATTLPSLVRAGRPRSQGSQPFPAINPTYWRILQKAR